MSTETKIRRITWKDAEKTLGFRVDRRRAYYFCDDPKMMEYFGGGPIYDYGEWVISCSGCRETEDGHNVGHYKWDAKAKCHIGAGCAECGYTGKRRDGIYAPVTNRLSRASRTDLIYHEH